MPVIGPSQRHLRRMVNGRLGGEVNESIVQPTIMERVITTEKSNMNIKKKPILTALNQYIYTDKYGVVNLRCSGMWLKDKKGQVLNTNQVFKKEQKKFIPVDDLMSFVTNSDWDKTQLFIRDPSKPNQNRYGYYGYSNELVAGQEKKIEIGGLTIRLDYNYSNDPKNLQSTQSGVHEEFSVSSKKELDEFCVLAIEPFRTSDFKHPLVQDIIEKKKFYLVGKGTVYVSKLYDYPSRENLICKVTDKEGAEYGIDSSCYNLFFLPTEKWNNPLKELDENIDELSLSPYLIREGKTFNIYWKPIEAAAEYIVSLYRTIELDGRIDLYHLKDYVVERNDNFLTLDGLIGNTFVFKVSAENRNGEVIAMSRGIKNGIPEFFTREEE